MYPHIRLSIACLAACLMLGVAASASAQAPKKAVKKVDPVVERARQRCVAQHGVDCDSPEGLREWLILEKPMTPEQQRSAAAARRLRASQTQAR